MEILVIEKTDETPGILMDKASGIFEISGRSLPEDTLAFYDPVVDWIRRYAEDPNDATDFVFKLDYFNTSSSKVILDLIVMLKNVKGARIKWYYQEDDEEVLAAGEEFAEQVDITFDFHSY